MPIDLHGDKWACEPCVRGHRSSKCQHFDRVMIRVKKPGRPLSSCPHNNPARCSCKQERVFMVKVRTDAQGNCICRPRDELYQPRYHNPGPNPNWQTPPPHTTVSQSFNVPAVVPVPAAIQPGEQHMSPVGPSNGIGYQASPHVLVPVPHHPAPPPDFYPPLPGPMGHLEFPLENQPFDFGPHGQQAPLPFSLNNHGHPKIAGGSLPYNDETGSMTSSMYAMSGSHMSPGAESIHGQLQPPFVGAHAVALNGHMSKRNGITKRTPPRKRNGKTTSAKSSPGVSPDSSPKLTPQDTPEKVSTGCSSKQKGAGHRGGPCCGGKAPTADEPIAAESGPSLQNTGVSQDLCLCGPECDCDFCPVHPNNSKTQALVNELGHIQEEDAMFEDTPGPMSPNDFMFDAPLMDDQNYATFMYNADTGEYIPAPNGMMSPGGMESLNWDLAHTQIDHHEGPPNLGNTFFGGPIQPADMRPELGLRQMRNSHSREQSPVMSQGPYL